MTGDARAPRGSGRSSEAIEMSIRSRIASGALHAGDRLGSERALAEEFQVSRSMVRQALDGLERAAVVRRVPGRGGGTFVSGTKIERDLSRVLGVPALLREQGMIAGSRIVSTGMVAADPATATALGLQPHALIVEVVRIRLADGDPISLDHARFPAARFPDLLELPLGGSLYELIEERYGVVPQESAERIEVEAAREDEAAILGIEPGATLISITRTTVDQDCVPFEYSHDLLRADRIRILVRTPSSSVSRLPKLVTVGAESLPPDPTAPGPMHG